MSSAPGGLNLPIWRRITLVLQQWPTISHGIIYGSRAMGNYRDNSDIDLTLLGDHDLAHEQLLDVIGQLDDLLLPYMIDCSLFARISDTSVVDHIRRVGQVIYDRERGPEPCWFPAAPLIT